MALRLITCACGHPAMLESGAINRAARIGAPIYCTRECGGIARRKNRSSEELKEMKRIYDAKRREELREQLRAEKRAYHKRTYDPIKAAAERKLKMPRHVEYCRRPEYKEYKREYDRKRVAEQQFGPFWEAAILVNDLQTEVLKLASRYEIDLQNDKLNKATKRKRAYEPTFGR